MKTRNIFTAIILSFTFIIVYNLSAFSYYCQTIRNDVVRLHILANSDSQEDQELKLKVRDAVLSEAELLTESVSSHEEALFIISSETDIICEIARKVINQNGYDYSVSAETVTEYFSTREYDGITIPAGRYNAIRITIGEGKGKNWWCMMFPSVCIPAADGNSIENVFNESQKNVTMNTSEYIIRFRIVEYFEMLKHRFSDD